MPASNDNKLKNGLKYFDAQPYSIQLNYKNRNDFKSATGGLISLVFYMAAAVIIVLNTKDFYLQTEFIFDQFLIKNDFSMIRMNREWFGVLIMAQNGAQKFNITFQNQEQYGLQVLVEQTNNPNDPNPTLTKAVPCTNMTLFNFTNFFCFPSQFDMTLAGRSDVYTNAPFHRVAWVIRNIPDDTETMKRLRQSVKISVIFAFLNNVTDPRQDQAILVANKIRKFSIRDGMSLSSNQLQQLTFYFQKLQVQTDYGLFFHEDHTSQSSFYDQEFNSNIITTDKQQNRLVYIKMKRSLFTLKYERHLKKVSTFLAETLGLIGTISLVFMIYKGYNKWCFTQKQLIPPKYQQKTNIFRYYFFLLSNFKKITYTSQVYEQFEHNLDIRKILERLDNLEVRLRRIEGRSSLVFEQGYEPQYARKKTAPKSEALYTTPQIFISDKNKSKNLNKKKDQSLLDNE